MPKLKYESLLDSIKKGRQNLAEKPQDQPVMWIDDPAENLQTIDDCLMNLSKSDTAISQKNETIAQLEDNVMRNLLRPCSYLEEETPIVSNDANSLRERIDWGLSRQSILESYILEHHQELEKSQELYQNYYLKDIKLLNALFARLLGHEENKNDFYLRYSRKPLRKIRRVNFYAKLEDEARVLYIFDFKKRSIKIYFLKKEDHDYFPEKSMLIRRLSFESLIKDLQD